MKDPGQQTMLKFHVAIGLFLLLSVPVAAGQDPVPPQNVFKDLFVAVEMERIFPDSKEFADAVPNSPPSDILALYNSERPQSQAELKRFVEEHFELPAELPSVAIRSNQVPIREHIDSLWGHLTRNSA